MDHRSGFAAGDIIAGVSWAFVLIPQSLAYAELAGLPPHYGLYAAMLPPIAAALLAASPYLQTGPVALTSLLTLGALVPLVASGTAEYAALAALLALVVGVARLLVGLARAGWVAYLMSQPVLMGFTTAAAVLIISLQLPTALGLVPPEGSVMGRVWWVATHVSQWEVASVVLAVIAIVLVLGGRRIHQLFPGALVAVALGVAFSLLTGYMGPIVGDVPRGLPPFSLDLPWSSVPHLVVPGIVIALVGFAEPSAIARTYAAQDRTGWNPDREFLSQGVANLAAGISGAFPVGGSFSRTALNRLSGGKTRWSGAVTGLVVLAFMPFADVLAPLPKAVLAAIVIAAVVKLIAFPSLVRLYRYSPPQALVAWTTFGATVVLAPRIDQAVLIGVILAFLVHAWREQRVDVTTRLDGRVLCLEPKGVLFFASAPGLDTALLRELAAHPDVEALQIDLGGLGRIDYTGAVALKAVIHKAQQAGLRVELTRMPPHARRILGGVLGDVASMP